MKKLLLIDGNSILFRSFYSTIRTNPMETSSGIPTNAVYGFILMLNKALAQIQPDAVLVAFDAGKPTFRHEMMEEYKGTRKQLPDELIQQMPIVREYLDEAELMRYEQPGFEADDIIGTVSAAAQDMETYILSGDQDMMQLVDQSTFVLMPQKGKANPVLFTVDKVKETYGVSPEHIIDLKGLMGDSSDNIPGVRGIGPKTASKLLEEYGSIENIYEHIDELKGATKKKMVDGKEAALLSKELATIVRDVKVPFGFEDLTLDENDEGKADFFLKYEMKSLLNTLKRPTRTFRPVKEVASISAIPQDREVFLLPVANEAPFMEAELYGFVISSNRETQYIPVESARKDENFLALLKRKNLSGWNVKRAWHLLNRNGFELPEFSEDLHLAAFLLHSQATSTEALLQVLQIELPESLKDLEKKSLGGFTEKRAVPVFGAWASQAEECLKTVLTQLQEENLDHLYREIELPLARILFEMEKIGIAIDLSVLKSIGVQYKDKMDLLEREIFEQAGHDFNILSPKQLATVIFDELKLGGAKKKRSTAAGILEELKDTHPIIPLILEYRKYSKIVTTYVDGLQKAAINGRIHTTFNQTMTQTGRLSSSDPNLQNISIRSEEGKEIRKAFIPSENAVLLSADYSQIELRMLAHMAQEEYMIQAFLDDVDIHSRTASLIFDVPADEVTEAQRRIAKTVNFAIIYGQTEYGLATELDISRIQAKQFINAYFASYPRISEYMDGIIDFCKEHGYVETLMKRRRAIPEIFDKAFMVREAGKRAAMNAPIQGSAADLIKIAMIHTDRAIKEKGLKSQMLLQIHDELIFNVPEEEIDIMKKLVAECMDHAMDLLVPLKADIHTGKNWYEAK